MLWNGRAVLSPKHTSVLHLPTFVPGSEMQEEGRWARIASLLLIELSLEDVASFQRPESDSLPLTLTPSPHPSMDRAPQGRARGGLMPPMKVWLSGAWKEKRAGLHRPGSPSKLPRAQA